MRQVAIALGTTIHPELIAPCGMNCAVCSHYLAFLNKIPLRKGITYCEGCRPTNKHCAMLRHKCQETLKLAEGEVDYCCDCDSYPCEKLSHLDRKYRERYGMSMIANLEEIRSLGLAEFIASQTDKYKCPRCGGLISVHNKKCFKCDKVVSWKE
ncbi:MAG: hypothetical protein B7Z63_00720 [Ignavibacteriae bacterium 37-53-5]|nr:MAG: hypothetical protein B7Z63_00720 [Ignavibacteriae bacterium 37-53-5]